MWHLLPSWWEAEDGEEQASWEVPDSSVVSLLNVINGSYQTPLLYPHIITPIMFIIHVNDMLERLNNYWNLFAYDAKIMIVVKK